MLGEIKAFLISSKFINISATALLGILLRYRKPDNIKREKRIYQALCGVVGVPITYTIDTYHNLPTALACLLTFFFAFYGFIIMDVVEQKLPDVMKRKIDEI